MILLVLHEKNIESINLMFPPRSFSPFVLSPGGRMWVVCVCVGGGGFDFSKEMPNVFPLHVLIRNCSTTKLAVKYLDPKLGPNNFLKMCVPIL